MFGQTYFIHIQSLSGHLSEQYKLNKITKETSFSEAWQMSKLNMNKICILFLVYANEMLKVIKKTTSEIQS